MLSTEFSIHRCEKGKMVTITLDDFICCLSHRVKGRKSSQMSVSLQSIFYVLFLQLINYGAMLLGVLFLQCALISAEEPWMASSHQPSASSCRNLFHAPRQNVMLKISQNDNLQHRSVIRNVEACKALCLRNSACRSITFHEVANSKR